MAPIGADLMCCDSKRFPKPHTSEVIQMRKKPETFLPDQKNREYSPFMEQLRQYQSAGVEITFKNARLPLEDIARICEVREKGEYMCDFVADEQNHIVRINLDDVRDQENENVWDGVLADIGKDGVQ